MDRAVAKHALKSASMRRAKNKTALRTGLGVGLWTERSVRRGAAETHRIVVPTVAPALIVNTRACTRGPVIVPVDIEPFLANQERIGSTVGDAAEIDVVGPPLPSMRRCE